MCATSALDFGRRPDVESDVAIKTAIAVCEHTELYDTTSYTTWLCYEHRHDVVKFSNISWLPQEIQSRNDDYAGCSLW